MENNRFHQLLYIFYASVASQALGKIKYPINDKISVNPRASTASY